MKNLTYVIATRKGSKRIKNKNVRKFGKSNLLEIKLKQIRRVDKKSKIFLSSDCKKSLNIGLKYGAIIDKRPGKYASDYVPMRAVYKYLAKKINTKNICYLHVTSPFLKDSTLKKAIKIFINNKQDLPNIYRLNFAVNIISTKTMRSEGRIVGHNFYPLKLEFPESLDIDDQWQFDIGKILLKLNKKNK